MKKQLTLVLFACLATVGLNAQVVVSGVGLGWAKNSINTVVFRKNSIASHGRWQYTAYYDSSGTVVLGKRKLPNGGWLLQQTPYKGNVNDAHNSISIAIDGDGYLHMAWDHHGHPLRYCKSVTPGSLTLTDKISMTGQQETHITYPEFYKLPNGNLLFLYRDGSSGNGNLVINRYNRETKQWIQIQQNLVNGEGKRNAYWQAVVDRKGTIHISWVWRESANVSSNHDLCYAKSDDEGKTWKRSDNTNYTIPITANSAEYVWRIPQESELINQASMCVTETGIPVIVTYWRNEKEAVPQYQVIFFNNGKWQHMNTGFRKTDFTLSGAGTRHIPISRPQVISWDKGLQTKISIIFRDEERNNCVSIATAALYKPGWRVTDIYTKDLGAWEPTYDTERWKQAKELYLFIQETEQKDGEGTGTLKPQPVSILQWKPGKK